MDDDGVEDERKEDDDDADDAATLSSLESAVARLPHGSLAHAITPRLSIASTMRPLGRRAAYGVNQSGSVASCLAPATQHNI